MPLEFASSLDDSNFSRTLKRMDEQSNKVADKITRGMQESAQAFGILAATAGTAAFAIKNVLDYFGNIADSASAVGLSAEAFQKYSGLLSEGGTNAQKFEMGMVSLNQAIQEAKNGSVEALDKFDELGVSWQNLQDMDTEGVLNGIASGLANASDQAGAYDTALDVFGKRNAKFVAQLRDHGDAFRDHAAQVKALTDAEVAELDKAGDAWDRLGNKIKKTTGGFLAGIFKFSDTMNGWSGQNPKQKGGKSSAAPDPFAGLPSMVGPKDPRTIAAEKALDESLKKANEESGREREATVKREATETEKLAQAWDKIAKITADYKKAMKEEAQRAQKERIDELTARKALLQERMQAEMAKETNFNLMGKDEVRDAMREKGRMDRAASRAQREKDAMRNGNPRKYKDARYGGGDVGGNLVQVAMDDATIKALAKEIGLQVDKIVAAP